MKFFIVIISAIILISCAPSGYHSGGYNATFLPNGDIVTIDAKGPGGPDTGGFLVDYGKCNVGSDAFSIKGSGTANRIHRGIDFKSELFVPIIASAPGEVIKILRDDDSQETLDNSAMVYLNHGNIVTGYHHLEQIPKDLKEGDKVARGQVLGLNGCTGLTRYPHVHWATYEYDPSDWLGRGRYLNPHGLWDLPPEDINSMKVKPPFFENGKEYRSNNRLTMPISQENCLKTWTMRHPTKPWRCR